MNTVIVPLASGHLPACAAIAAFAPDPWTPAGLRAAWENPHCRCYAALRGGVPVGFACFLALAGSADLQLVAVHPDCRRRGVARALLGHAFRELAALGIEQCLLEVRCQNAAAAALYAALGFRTLARRAAMFQNPPDDGFLMVKKLAREQLGEH